MLYKFSSILVVGMMVLGQPITVFANTIDSELQTNNSVSEEHEEISDALVESSEITLDKTVESVVDSGLTVDSISEESTPSYSTNNETDSSEESNNSDEVEKKKETLAEDIVAGTWGSVPWEWNSETATITLQGGNAGTVAAAPWKTYTTVQSIVAEGTVVLQANAANLFQNLKSLTYIDTLSFDTSQVTTFDFLFANSDSLEVLNLNGWNTSNVRSINRTFHNMTSLVELDIRSWNMANVGSASTNAWFIFEARNLRTIHLGVNTTFLHMNSSSRPVFQAGAPSVEYTGNWLYLKDQNGNDPEERVVTARRTLLSTFYDGSKPGTYILEKKVSQPVTVKFLDSEGNELAPSVTIEGEFGSQYSTEAKEIPGWSVVEIPRNATGTFTQEEQVVLYLYEYESSQNLWGTVPWSYDEENETITLYGGEAGLVSEAPWKAYPSVKTIIINDSVTLPIDSSSLFATLNQLQYIKNADKLDVSNVENMNNMFDRTVSLKEADISNWQTSNVETMQFMFQDTGLSTLDLSNWDVSNVENMVMMFSQASSLEKLDVSNWQLSNSPNMILMFFGATNLSELDLSSWDTSNNFATFGIFNEMASLNRITLGDKSLFSLSATALPEIIPTNQYTGRWILQGNEDVIFENSTEFMANYDGSSPGTYIWERVAPEQL
ncbi:BspA family leucine-rich repeat surface protein, partial [Enterococcus casseliflavus]|nr:BspA family leucine-rich repeat surface protein [Enterococcus casseliflavus]